MVVHCEILDLACMYFGCSTCRPSSLEGIDYGLASLAGRSRVRTRDENATRRVLVDDDFLAPSLARVLELGSLIAELGLDEERNGLRQASLFLLVVREARDLAPFDEILAVDLDVQENGRPVAPVAYCKYGTM